MPSMSFAQAVQQPTTLKTFPADSIVGKWVRSGVGLKQKKRVRTAWVSCNVCPEINFKADSTATFKLQGTSQNATDAFLWCVNGRNLVVLNLKGENKTSLLSAGQYHIGTRAEGALGLSRELVLTGADGTRHILIRSYD